MRNTLIKRLGMIFIICISVITVLHINTQDDKNTIITYLTVNNRINPLGIEGNPIFGWQMQSNESGQWQLAYKIQVALSEQDLIEGRYIWSSGQVQSDSSIGINYEGEKLNEGTRYYWRVIVWNQQNDCIWSDIAYFETGITNWSGAQWIAAPELTTSGDCFSYDITYDFSLNKNTSAGFIWGADRVSQGDYYLLYFSTDEEAAFVTLADVGNENISDLCTINMDGIGYDVDGFCGKEHKVEISADGSEIEVFIDEEDVMTFELPIHRDLGYIGVWYYRDYGNALIDNILVKDKFSNILYSEDFENEKTIFNPYYIKIVDGKMEVSHGTTIVPGGETPAPVFMKKFGMNGEKHISDARLYCSALGIYDVAINNIEVSDEYFAPGMSYYDCENKYRVYDITELLDYGDNIIKATIGHGRYDRARNNWGDQLAFIGKIVLNYDDGTSEVLVTDDSWVVDCNGPVRRDDYFWGEYIDNNYVASLENGIAAECLDGMTTDNLHVSMVEPVREVDTLLPALIGEPYDGCYVYDFGQNFSGYCRLAVSGDEGQVITIRYAEELNREETSVKDDIVGTIWTNNLLAAKDTDYFVLSGEDEEIFDPKFVYRGFRYVQITGLSEPIANDKIEGVVLAADLNRTGYFDCSDELLNQIYSNIYWTQLSNFTDIPTDCPQRDERFAWAGDVQVFTNTAAYNADVHNYLSDFLKAFRYNQEESGSLPDEAYKQNDIGGNIGWADAGVIIPWQLYLHYGDINILKDNYSMMQNYGEYVLSICDGYICNKQGFGDLIAVNVPDESCTNTAQCAYVFCILSKTATALGYSEDAEQYSYIYESFKNEYQNEFIGENGEIGYWLQSDFSLALAFGLYPDELTECGAGNLRTTVESSDYHITTGFISTPHLLPMLSEHNSIDVAYKVMQQTTYPSIGYLVSKGATTMTESWTSYRDEEDGTVSYNGSFNHFALGSVGAWYYEYVLGIQMDEDFPGYKHFYLRPMPGGGLSYANGYIDSPYGRIESSWRYADTSIELDFIIPANTSATVILPGENLDVIELASGTHHLEVSR